MFVAQSGIRFSLSKMKITKTYCDICKKEMKESAYSFEIKLQRQGYRGEENIEIEEMCSVCLDRAELSTFTSALLISGRFSTATP